MVVCSFNRWLTVSVLILAVILAQPSFAAKYPDCPQLLDVTLVWDSHREQSKILVEDGANLVRIQAPELQTLFASASRTIQQILSDAIQNAYQHGSQQLHLVATGPSILNPEALEENAHAFAKLGVEWSDDYLTYTVINYQVKMFPSELQGEFVSGSSPRQLYIPDSSRFGHRGLGFAHDEMLYQLQKLPAGSTLSWWANGTFVKFKLKVKLR